ncbi:MAG: hypothetical protein JWQ74_3583 [Marmoricola sp.]|nr:hypothetical protein [Marmoricola sp.]
MKKILLATTAIFAIFAQAAHADPITASIGALLTSSLGATGVTVGSIVLGVASMGAQWLLGKLLAPDVKDRGVKSKMETGGDKPPAFILGEYPTAGALDYANVWDGGSKPNAVLTYVIILSALPVDSISNYIFVNNERCTIDWNVVDEDGFSSVEEYSKDDGERRYCRVKFYDGTQTGADPWLIEKFGDDEERPWLDDMHLDGCAYVIVQSWFSSKGIWSGNPTFRFVLRGLPLYDPRKDSTVGGSGAQRWATPSTWTFSKNAKVLEYNVLRGIYYKGDWVWGGNAQAYRLPLDYWFAAMNVCDENVTKKDDTVVKRYEAGCEISFDDKPIEIIDEINKACCGYTTEYGGTYKTWCGSPGLSVATITDDDWIITADMETNRFQSLQTTYNTAYATYPEPKEQWESKDGPQYQDADALAEDGQELAIDIPLPFVSENNQVQRIMRATVKDSRRQLTHAGQLPPEAFVFEPNDRITYISSKFGYHGDGKDFIISSKEDLPNVNQQLMLRELNPDDTGWLKAYELDHRVGPLTLVKPGAMNLDFTLTADQIDSENGKDKPAILVEWDWAAIDIDVENIKWELRRDGTTKVIAEGRIRNPEDGERTFTHNALRFGKTYQMRLKAEPIGNRDSLWTAWKTITLVNLDIPGAPVLTRVSDLADDGTLDFFVDVDWTAIPAEVTYVVEIVSDGKTWTRSTERNSYRLPATSGKYYTFRVRAIGADGGTKGDWSGATSITVTKKNTAPTTPAGLTLAADFKRLILGWTKSPDKDYFATRVYRSATNDFTTATAVHEKAGNGWVDDGLPNLATRYYWITHLDRSGNESAKWPVSNTGGISGTTTVVTDNDTDGTSPSAPTGLSVTQRTFINGDGKVDIQLVVSWTGIANKKATYVVRVDDGTDFDYFDVKDVGPGTATVHRKKIPAVSGALYTISVAAVNGLGAIGSYTSNVTITPSKKSILPAAPTGLSLVADFKKLVLSWPKAIDADYSKTRVYRATTNDFTTATEVKEIKASGWTDDGLPNLATRYYWITFIDRSNNESAKWPVSNTGGISGTTTVITDSDTDSGSPATPTSLAVTQRTNLNGDGKVEIELVVTFTGIANKKATYVVRVDDGTDFDYVSVKDIGPGSATTIRKKIAAISGVSYSISVAAVNGAGTIGSYTSNVSITPSKKATAPTAPTALTAVGKLGRTVLRFNKSPDADYLRTNIYAANVNNFASASLLDSVSSTKFGEGDLGNGVSRWYWITFEDRSQNESAKFPVSNTGGIIATTVRVTDDDTDPTPPNVPGSPTIGAGILERLDDGSIQAHTDVSWTAPGAGVPVKGYMLKVTQVSTGKVRDFPVDGLSTSVEVKTGKAYNYQVAAVNAFGKVGTYTSAVAFTRSKKAGDLTSPGAVTIAAFKRRITLDWIDIDDDLYPDYRITWIYKNQTGVAPTVGVTTPYKRSKSGFLVDHNVTNGITYYYWICHVDNSGNKTALSAVVSSASAGNEVTAFVDLTGQVTNPMVAPSAITDDKFSGQLDFGKVRLQTDGNLFRNPGFRNGNFSGWALSGLASVVTRAAATVAGAPATYVGKLVGDGTWSNSFNLGNPADFFEVSAGETFAARYFAAADGITGTGTIFLACGFQNASGDGVTDFQVASANVVTLDAAGTWQEITGLLTAPTLVNGLPTAQMFVYFQISNTVTGGSVYIAKPRLRRATTNDMLTLNAVAEGNLQDDSISTLKVKKRAINAGRMKFDDRENLIPVGDFDQFANADWTDIWDFTGGAVTGLDTGNYWLWNGDAESGSLAFILDNKVTGGASGGTIGQFSIITEDYIPVKALKPYAWETAIRTTDGSSAVGFYYRMNWYNRLKVALTPTDVIGNGPIPSAWATYEGFVTPPAGACFCRPQIYHNSNATTRYLIVDRLVFRKAKGAELTAPLSLDRSKLGAGSVPASKLSRSDDGLVPNGKFIDGVEGWSFGVATSVIADTATNEGGAFILRTGDRDAAYSDWFDVDNGEAIFARAYVKSGSGVGETMNLMLHTSDDANGNQVWQVFQGTNVKGVWTLLQGTIPVTNAFARRGRILLQCEKVSGSTPTVYNYWGKVKARRAAHTESIPDGDITDGKADQTAAGTPAAPTVGQGVIETSDDGVQQAHIDVSWSTPAGVPVKSYVVRATQTSNGKVLEYPATGLSLSIPAKTGKAYNIQVAAVNAFGKVGTFSSATAITRAKKSGGVPAPGAVTLTGLKKRVKVDWTDVDDDTYPDYRNTAIWVNTTGTVPTPGTTPITKRTKSGYFNFDNASASTTYYFWIAHRDNSGNFGALSTVVSIATGANGEVSSFADLSGAASDTQIDATPPGKPNAAPALVAVGTYNSDGAIDGGLTLTITAPVGGRAAKKYRIELYRSTTLGTPGNNVTGYTLFDQVYSNFLTKDIRGNSNFFYKARAIPISANDIEGTPSDYTNTGVRPLQASAPSPVASVIVGTSSNFTSFTVGMAGGGPFDPDYEATEVFYSSTNDYSVATAIAEIKKYGRIPFTSSFTGYFWFRNRNRSGQVSSVWPTQFAGSLGGASQIATAYIEDHGVNTNFYVFDNAGQAVAAATKTLVEDIVVTYPAGAAQLEVLGMFRKTTAGAHVIDITIESSTGTVYQTVQNSGMDQNECGYIFVTIDSPAGTSMTLRMYVYTPIAVSVQNTKLSVNVRKR